MSKLVFVLAAAVSLNAFAAAPHTRSSNAVQANYGKLPLSFEANQGQTDPRVKFLSRGQGYSLFLTDTTAILSLSKGDRTAALPARGVPSAEAVAGFKPRTRTPKQTGVLTPERSESDLIRMSLPGANPNASATGESELPGKVNYFLGADPAKWHSDLPTYAKVRYSSVYPGIDLVYYGNQQQLEYDFIVAPEASPAAIRLGFSGQKHLTLAFNGDLILQGKDGQAAFHKPVLYQQQGTLRQPISGSFRLLAHNIVTFKLGNYDHSRPLIIDPILVYSTYLGGSGGAGGNGIAADADGNAYVVGSAGKAPYPWEVPFPVTPGAYQTQGGGIFVTKYNAGGTALIYSTLIGGTSNSDFGNAIAIDSFGNAYVTGATASTDFPVTSGAFQATNKAITSAYPSFSAFVTKLNPTGSSLIYSTYLGGSGDYFRFGNVGTAIATDSSADAYVTGWTATDDFPVTVGAFRTRYPGEEHPGGASQVAFVTKLSPDGTTASYSTYLGGSGVQGEYPYFGCGRGLCSSSPGGDQGRAIAIDASGDVFVAGSTNNTDFPVTSGAFQKVNRAIGNRQANAFVAQLNPSGSALVYATYLGGSGPAPNQYPEPYFPDSVNAIAVDTAGNAYLAGVSHSTNFPVTTGTFITTASGVGTGFVAKLNATGSALDYSTYFGGDYASANGIAIDFSGNAYVTGFAQNYRFPVTTDAAILNSTTQWSNEMAFVAKINPSATTMYYSSLLGAVLGGQGGTVGNAVALDTSGDVFITGATGSYDFLLTSGALQTYNNGPYNENSNAFVGEFALEDETVDHFPTQTEISAPVTFSDSGPEVTLKAIVIGGPGGSTPTGQVEFFGTDLTSTFVTLDGTGTATWTPSPLKLEAHSAYATYLGDGTHLTSAGANNVTFRAVGPPAQLKAIAGLNQLGRYSYGKPITPLVAQVTDSTGYPVEGVPVTFTGAGLTFIPSPSLTDVHGKVSVTPVPAAFGTFAVTASVAGLSQVAQWPLKIIPAILSISTPIYLSRYGQTPAQPTVYSLSGFVNGDTQSVVSGAPTLSTTVTATTAVGYYPIMVSLGTLTAANYSFVPVLHNGFVHVTKVPLILTVNDVTIHRGDPIPTFTYTLTGFVNGDTQSSSVTGSPALSTPAGSSSHPSVYPIYIGNGTLRSVNYSITLVRGTLTILP